MQKLIFKCVVMLIVVVGASNYMLYITTGASPFSGFSWSKWRDKVPSLNTASIESLSPVSGTQTVYKWVDANGVTQYSTEAPPETTVAQTLELDPNTNIVQSVKLPEEAAEESKSTPQVALPEGPIYSPDNVKQLMDNAKNVQKLLNERHNNQQKALDSL